MMKEIEKSTELMVVLKLLPSQGIQVVAGKWRLAAMQPEKGDLHAGGRLPLARQDLAGRKSQVGTGSKTDRRLVGFGLKLRICTLGAP